MSPSPPEVKTQPIRKKKTLQYLTLKKLEYHDGVCLQVRNKWKPEVKRIELSERGNLTVSLTSRADALSL
jgi:hypothetical protein